MKHHHFMDRCLAMLLVIATLAGLLVTPASAASSGTLANSQSVTIKRVSRGEYLSKSSGGTIGGYWEYTSNDGLTGTAYCINWVRS